MPLRLRMPRSALLAVGVLTICTIPLASVSPWLLIVFVIPALAGAWVLRSGVDLDEDAVTMRAAFGVVRVPWAGVAGVSVGARGQLSLVRTDGGAVAMPTMRTRDLPRLYEASDGRLGVPPAPAQ